MIDTLTTRARRVRELLSTYSGLDVLDVGCEEGQLLEPVAKKNRVCGIDVNPAATRAVERGYLKALCASAEEKIPFDDASFDLVYSGECIEHVIDTDRYLSEIWRVLRPNGKLLLTTPNVRTIQTIGRMLLCNLPSPAAAQYRTAHVRDWTTRLLKEALINNRYRVEWMEGVDFTGYLPMLARPLPSLASAFIVQCSKAGS